MAETKTDRVGQKKKPTPFMVRLGPFTVSVYWYSVPGLEEGWAWRVAGRAISDEPFKTMDAAKWDLANQIWDIVSPLRIFANKMRKKGEG